MHNFQRVDILVFYFIFFTIYVRCKCVVAAARRAGLFTQQNDRRYELEMEESINYMLSNNFMLFSVVVVVVAANLLFSSLADWRTSPENMTEFRFIILVEFVWLAVSCVILATHALLWRRYGCAYWLSNKRISCRWLSLHRCGYVVNHGFAVAVRIVQNIKAKASHRHHRRHVADNKKQVQNTHRHAFKHVLCAGQERCTSHMHFA